MTDFGDRPFLAGSLIGLRSFRVAHGGWLTGVVHAEEWKPGENVAECLSQTSMMRRQMEALAAHLRAAQEAAQQTAEAAAALKRTLVSNPNRFASGGYIGPTTPDAAPERPKREPPAYVDLTSTDRRKRNRASRKAKAAAHSQPLNSWYTATVTMTTQHADMTVPYVWEPEPHEMVTVDCTCGFYAYFDGSNDYYRHPAARMQWTGLGWHSVDMISGIVEGYGKVVVGDRGFRAEKARIIALIITDADRVAFPDFCRMVEANYQLPVFASEAAALAEFPLTNPSADLPT